MTKKSASVRLKLGTFLELKAIDKLHKDTQCKLINDSSMNLILSNIPGM